MPMREPRPASYPFAFLHTDRNASCTVSSASAGCRSTRCARASALAEYRRNRPRNASWSPCPIR